MKKTSFVDSKSSLNLNGFTVNLVSQTRIFM